MPSNPDSRLTFEDSAGNTVDVFLLADGTVTIRRWNVLGHDPSVTFSGASWERISEFAKERTHA
jgi:hypothetical protein